MKISAIVLSFSVLTTLSACTFQTKHRGYVFPENLETEIKSVKTTAQLEEKLGSPQVKTVYGEPVWIYFSADENYHGPTPLTYDNKMALLVWPDSAGNIKKTKVMHDQDFKDVKIAKGETQVPAAVELNAVQELFNNIGRFTPAGLGQ